MKVSLLTAIFEAFESALSSEGNNDFEEFCYFRRIFVGHDKSTVEKLIGKLQTEGELKAVTKPSAAILRLQQRLERLKQLLLAAKVKDAEKDFSAIHAFLSQCGHTTVEELTTAVAEWQTPAYLVRRYSDQLHQASDDNGAFDRVVERLKADKAIRKEEMHKITALFLGCAPNKVDRKKNLEMIVDRQALDARQDARGRAIARQR